MGQTGLLFRFEKDAEKKAADEKKLFGETMPKIFGLWESRLTHKFLTDDKVTRMCNTQKGRWAAFLAKGMVGMREITMPQTIIFFRLFLFPDGVLSPTKYRFAFCFFNKVHRKKRLLQKDREDNINSFKKLI